jgi:hypothetical protein
MQTTIKYHKRAVHTIISAKAAATTSSLCCYATSSFAESRLLFYEIIQIEFSLLFEYSSGSVR